MQDNGWTKYERQVASDDNVLPMPKACHSAYACGAEPRAEYNDVKEEQNGAMQPSTSENYNGTGIWLRRYGSIQYISMYKFVSEAAEQ